MDIIDIIVNVSACLFALCLLALAIGLCAGIVMLGFGCLDSWIWLFQRVGAIVAVAGFVSIGGLMISPD
ncbi:MAG: hypothetical protein WC485_04840 [Opitutaceae bacterium]